jgi:hypothetical protein
MRVSGCLLVESRRALAHPPGVRRRTFMMIDRAIKRP